MKITTCAVLLAATLLLLGVTPESHAQQFEAYGLEGFVQKKNGTAYRMPVPVQPYYDDYIGGVPPKNYKFATVVTGNPSKITVDQDVATGEGWFGTFSVPPATPYNTTPPGPAAAQSYSIFDDGVPVADFGSWYQYWSATTQEDSGKYFAGAPATLTTDYSSRNGTYSGILSGLGSVLAGYKLGLAAFVEATVKIEVNYPAFSITVTNLDDLAGYCEGTGTFSDSDVIHFTCAGTVTYPIYNAYLQDAGIYHVDLGGMGAVVFFGTDAHALSGVLFLAPTSNMDPITHRTIPDNGVSIELAFGACKAETNCKIQQP